MNQITPSVDSQSGDQHSLNTNGTLVNEFWNAHPLALFNQVVIACVRNVSVGTLENERWRGMGIPYRKVCGRILYRKEDVVNFLENYALQTSTSKK